LHSLPIPSVWQRCLSFGSGHPRCVSLVLPTFKGASREGKWWPPRVWIAPVTHSPDSSGWPRDLVPLHPNHVRHSSLPLHLLCTSQSLNRNDTPLTLKEPKVVSDQNPSTMGVGERVEVKRRKAPEVRVQAPPPHPPRDASPRLAWLYSLQKTLPHVRHPHSFVFSRRQFFRHTICDRLPRHSQ